MANPTYHLSERLGFSRGVRPDVDDIPPQQENPFKFKGFDGVGEDLDKRHAAIPPSLVYGTVRDLYGPQVKQIKVRACR